MWPNNPTNDIKTYELFTLTYGTSVVYSDQSHSTVSRSGSRFPKRTVASYKDFYINNFISGANIKEETIEIRNQATALLEKGSFKLCKWASNSRDLLGRIQDLSARNQILELDRYEVAKTLGINWSSKTYTKRAILSQSAQIFNSLSLLGQIVTKAKILMQRLWKIQVWDWDEPIPLDINTECLATSRLYKTWKKLVYLARS